jgi:hypothetical protein
MGEEIGLAFRGLAGNSIKRIGYPITVLQLSKLDESCALFTFKIWIKSVEVNRWGLCIHEPIDAYNYLVSGLNLLLCGPRRLLDLILGPTTLDRLNRPTEGINLVNQPTGKLHKLSGQ